MLLVALAAGGVSVTDARAAGELLSTPAPTPAPAPAEPLEETPGAVPWDPLMVLGLSGVAVQVVYGVVAAPVAVLCFPAWAAGAVAMGLVSGVAQWRVAAWRGWRVPAGALALMAAALGGGGALASSGFFGCGCFLLFFGFTQVESERLQGLSYAASGAALVVTGLLVSVAASVTSGVVPALTAVWLGRVMTDKERDQGPHMDVLDVPPPPKERRLRRARPAETPTDQPNPAPKKRNRTRVRSTTPS